MVYEIYLKVKKKRCHEAPKGHDFKLDFSAHGIRSTRNVMEYISQVTYILELSVLNKVLIFASHSENFLFHNREKNSSRPDNMRELGSEISSPEVKRLCVWPTEAWGTFYSVAGPALVQHRTQVRGPPSGRVFSPEVANSWPTDPG